MIRGLIAVLVAPLVLTGCAGPVPGVTVRVAGNYTGEFVPNPGPPAASDVVAISIGAVQQGGNGYFRGDTGLDVIPPFNAAGEFSGAIARTAGKGLPDLAPLNTMLTANGTTIEGPYFQLTRTSSAQRPVAGSYSSVYLLDGVDAASLPCGVTAIIDAAGKLTLQWESTGNCTEPLPSGEIGALDPSGPSYSVTIPSAAGWTGENCEQDAPMHGVAFWSAQHMMSDAEGEHLYIFAADAANCGGIALELVPAG